MVSPLFFLYLAEMFFLCSSSEYISEIDIFISIIDIWSECKGYYEPHNTFRPFYYQYLNQLPDENGKPLNAQEGALALYQNPGYDY